MGKYFCLVLRHSLIISKNSEFIWMVIIRLIQNPEAIHMKRSAIAVSYSFTNTNKRSIFLLFFSKQSEISLLHWKTAY